MDENAYRIGLIGVGRMGANMARRLVDIGKGAWDESAVSELTFPDRGETGQ